MSSLTNREKLMLLPKEQLVEKLILIKSKIDIWHDALFGIDVTGESCFECPHCYEDLGFEIDGADQFDILKKDTCFDMRISSLDIVK